MNLTDGTLWCPVEQCDEIVCDSKWRQIGCLVNKCVYV